MDDVRPCGTGKALLEEGKSMEKRRPGWGRDYIECAVQELRAYLRLFPNAESTKDLSRAYDALITFSAIDAPAQSMRLQQERAAFLGSLSPGRVSENGRYIEEVRNALERGTTLPGMQLADRASYLASLEQLLDSAASIEDHGFAPERSPYAGGGAFYAAGGILKIIPEDRGKLEFLRENGSALSVAMRQLAAQVESPVEDKLLDWSLFLTEQPAPLTGPARSHDSSYLH
ncbi:hypothetical protein J4439_00680 [Candidatus Woesearchaeota archaeon]|nr:hypothetical protein [Candidatus Woesearchaeota archaeon]